MSIGIGLVGIGFMGTTHFKAYKELKNAHCAAIADAIPQRLTGDWRDIRGNFGEGGGVHDLTGINKHSSLESLLADASVDLVDICLPTHLHANAVISALNAGKDVIVEKPIALTNEDARAMVAAAKANGRKLFVSHVVRFFPEYQFVKQLVQSGQYGKLLGIHTKRVISRPDWGANTWFGDPKKTGGAVVDLAIHDFNFLQYILGLPKAVFASGHVTDQDEVVYVNANLIYDKTVSASVSSGAIAMPGRPWEQGFDVYFEKAMLQFNTTWGKPVAVLTLDGKEEHPNLPEVDPFVAELQYAVDSLLGKESGELLLGHGGAKSLEISLACAESARTGKVVPISQE